MLHRDGGGGILVCVRVIIGKADPCVGQKLIVYPQRRAKTSWMKRDSNVIQIPKEKKADGLRLI